jgi:hypothetical protein
LTNLLVQTKTLKITTWLTNKRHLKKGENIYNFITWNISATTDSHRFILTRKLTITWQQTKTCEFSIKMLYHSYYGVYMSSIKAT